MITADQMLKLVLASLHAHKAERNLIGSVLKDMTDALKSHTGGTLP